MHPLTFVRVLSKSNPAGGSDYRRHGTIRPTTGSFTDVTLHQSHTQASSNSVDVANRAALRQYFINTIDHDCRAMLRLTFFASCPVCVGYPAESVMALRANVPAKMTSSGRWKFIGFAALALLCSLMVKHTMISAETTSRRSRSSGRSSSLCKGCAAVTTGSCCKHRKTFCPRYAGLVILSMASFHVH